MVSISAFQQLQDLSQKKKKQRKGNAVEDNVDFLSICIGGKYIGIRTSDIAEVAPLMRVSLVGHTVSWFKGLIKVQGDIYGLVDIANFLGVSPVAKKDGYIIALSRRYDNVAIVVDSLAGLHSITTEDAPLIKDCLDVYQMDGKEVKILSIERLISSDEFLDISIFNN